MTVTTETLTLFVVLLPGFLSSIILNTLVARKAQDIFSRTVEALVFSFLIYGILIGLFGVSPLVTEKGNAAVSPLFVLIALLLAVVLPMTLGLLHTTGIHMKTLNRLKITRRTSRENVWLDVFTDQNRHVICNLTGRRRVYGWPMYFSEDMERPCLYLYNPAWVNDDGTYADIGAHGIFLVEKDSIESIEFVDLVDVTEKAAPTNERGNDVG